jgi:hypothetical protein
MGTRSSTRIVDNTHGADTTLARLYIQYDGYPTGVGAQIKDILGGKTMVNGYNDADTQINGAGCMGAMLIDGLKNGCGGVYLTDPSEEERESYHYEVRCDGPGKPIHLKVCGYDDQVLYEGSLDEFDPAAVEAAEG